MTDTTRHSLGRPTREQLIGFHVESVGGPTGIVDPDTRLADDRYLVVRTGRWPLRQKKVVVPAAAINCVDSRRRRVWLERNRNEVRKGPVFERTRHGRVRVPRPVAAPTG